MIRLQLGIRYSIGRVNQVCVSVWGYTLLHLPCEPGGGGGGGGVFATPLAV